MKNLSLYIGLTLVVTLIVTGGVFLWQRNTNTAWRAVEHHIMPQFIPASDPDIEDLVSTEFSPLLHIAFVIDGPEQYAFIAEDSLQEWDINEEILQDTALRNLESRSRDLQVEVAKISESTDAGTYIIVEKEDPYSAVRLLSTGVRRAVAREIGDEYVAAIPTRDFLIFWHREFPLQDAFLDQVRSEYDSEQEYALSPNPFVISPLGIQPMLKVKNE